MFHRPVPSVLIISLLLVLVGCGQKGGLYLPVSEPEEQKMTQIIIPVKTLLPEIYS